MNLLPRLILASTALSASLAASPALAGTTPGTPTVASGSNINFSTDTGLNATASAGTTVTSVDGTANQLNIQLGSNSNSIINWNSFDVAGGASVNFSSNSNSAVLNRVTGGTFSNVLGAISGGTNVEIWLMNSNGILVGDGASISGRNLVLSTLGVTDADFLNGGSVNLTGASSGGISLGSGSSLTLAGSVVIASQSAAVSGAISATGDVAVVGARDVVFTAGIGSPLAMQINTGALAGNSISVGGTANVTGGSIGFAGASSNAVMTTLLGVNAGATLTATKADGVVLLATADFAGSGVSIALPDNANDAIVSGGSLTATGSGGDVMVMASGNATVAGAVSAKGDYLAQGRAVSLGNGNSVAQSAGGMVTITATTGAIEGAPGLTLMSNSDAVGIEELRLRGTSAAISMAGTTIKAGSDKQSAIVLYLPRDVPLALTLGDVSAGRMINRLADGTDYCWNCWSLPLAAVVTGDLDFADSINFYDVKSLSTGSLNSGTLIAARALAGSVTIDGSITTPQLYAQLHSTGGNVAVSGVIDAPTFFGSATGSFTANAQNSFDTLWTVTAGGAVQINNTGNLSVGSTVSSAAGSVSLATTGDLAIGAGITAGGGGSIDLTAGGLMSGATGVTLVGQDITLSADDWTGGILDAALLQETRDLTINDTAGGFTLGFDMSAQRNLGFNALNGGNLTLLGKLSSVGDSGAVTATGSEVTIGSTGQIAGRDVVVSSTGAFTNQSGSDAIVATGGHWVVYAASPAGSSFDNLNSGQTAIWNKSRATLAPGAITGNRYVFAHQPTLAVTTTGASKTYGDDLTGALSEMYTISGLHAGVAGAFLADTASSVFSGGPTITSSGAAADADVGSSPYAVTASQGSLTLLNGYGLSLVNAGEITVDPKALTVTVGANDKTYDGTTAATGSISLGGVLTGDQVSTSGTSFAFVEANAGSDKAITVSGTVLTGADAGNYTIAVPASVLADIFAKQLTVTVTANDKTYDGNTGATGTLALGGIIGNDQVSAGASFAFTDKKAGADKVVTVSDALLSGADAGNYTITVPASALADIFARQLTLTVIANDKTYDGNTSATGSVTVGGLIGDDQVTASGAAFEFADANAGVGKTVVVSGTTLTGDDAGNYIVTVPGTVLADILAKQLTVTVSADDKTYDGTTAATGTVSLGGIVGDDQVTAGASFAFADHNAGTDKTVHVSNGLLNGVDAGNYTISVPTSVLADVLAKQLTVTVAADNKTYDGTTDATGSLTLGGLIGNDDVSATADFAFTDKNAGTDRTVAVTDAALTGADAGNYTITVPASVLADVLAKEITATVTADDKTYDGNTSASGNLELNGLIGDDEVSAFGTVFEFANANAGVGKMVAVSGTTLTGGDASNYIVTAPESVLADIFVKQLTVTVAADDKTYDGTVAATGSLSLDGIIGDDQVVAGANFAFTDRNAGSDKTVMVSNALLSGADAGNYAITVPASVLADIFAKQLTATAVANDKTYDGTLAGTGAVVLEGVISGDQVTAGGTFTFQDANAGSGKAVVVSNASLSGADASNYTVSLPTGAAADILAKQLVATVSANDKTYDGTTTASGNVSLTGVIVGDEVLVGGASFAFADKNAGANKAVIVSGVSVTGADAGNYVVSVPANAVADIFAKELVATVTANDKTYDGTTTTSGSVSLVGIVAGDSVSVGGTTFLFADSNAGTGKAVTVSGTTLTGADADNYRVTVPNGTVANVLVRAIVIAAQDAGKPAGQADPALTYIIGGAGLVAGDTLSGALAREVGETPGAYAIQQGTLSGGNNYEITFEDGTFTITAAPEEPQQPDDGIGGQDNLLRALQLPSQAGGSGEAERALISEDALCEVEDEDCVVVK